MKNIKKIILRITLLVTIMSAAFFSIKGYQLNKLIQRVDRQIALDEKELFIQKRQLQTLQDEMAQVNTVEYIEKVAREELGMVKESDIVFRQKK